MRLFPILLAVSLASFALACSDGNNHSYGYGGGPSSSGTPAGTNVTPLLVDVDTGKTMTATPGDGVGIFVEYRAGGKWHVYWTCDTNKTGLGCQFNIQVASVTGSLQNLAVSGQAQGDDIRQTDASTINATTSTSSNAVDITFDADSGGTIEITAAVGGIQDSSFFFFVQDGAVNGGYQGKLTDPLRFEGKTP